MRTVWVFQSGTMLGSQLSPAVSDDGCVLALAVDDAGRPAMMLHVLGVTSRKNHGRYRDYFQSPNFRVQFVCNPDSHDGVKAALLLNRQKKQ